MMKRKLSISSVVALLLMAVLLTFLMTDFSVANQFNEKLEELDAEKIEFQKLATLDAIVREHYALKPNEVNQSEGAISGYVDGLGDGYSRYLTADEYAEYLLQLEEKPVYSLGFSVGYHEKTKQARICHVEQSSDAKQFGLEVGDVLLSIGEVSVKSDGFDAVSSLLVGKKNSSTGVVVLRDGEKVTYTLQYSNWKKDRVSARLVLGQAAYICIRSFEDGAREDLKTAIDQMISAGADALVFDVRGGRSTDFREAVECADVIAGMNDLARVLTKGETQEVLKGDGASVPLSCAVLIDGETYGAPELFAASLRDTVEAKLVGSKSAGCASLQSDIKLNDNSAVILTTEVFLPPVADSFEGVGVKPDEKIKSRYDFKALSPEEDPVLSGAYYLLKPDKVPGEDEPIVVPDTDTDSDDPQLIEPNMKSDTGSDGDPKDKK